VRNPFRSESGSFRFVLAVLVAALAIVGASWVNAWLGVAAAVLAVVALFWWLVQEPVPGAAEPPPKLASATPPGTHRVLVVAPPGAGSAPVPERATDVVVVVPALASKLEAATGAVDDRRAEAELTAQRLTRALARDGRSVRGEVGADDPVLAVEDALRMFGADEIVVAGDVDVAQIREHVALPVVHG
jgi:hypothetical protein